ncbi:hypothetical protein B0H16DRAFT_1741442 [Mycena metata]|uniref:Uncharacterized protein n=1 Tax=Mycena metata TaxID=1033252 RepID=A0AAD7HAZ3_9AGAR|nr:hypothetical protein B0H16DRAFT_1741442 [Mycena metata]
MTQRKRKRSATKHIAKKDRRNLKLWAEGACESILKPHIPGYTDALERGWRAERDYLLEVCNEFHAQIDWRLEDHEEPELPLPTYDKFAQRIEEELDTEELTMKRLKIETMNARIARWLKYRARSLARPLKMDRTRDPWAIFLAKLAGVNSPPKARQAFQQYMHELYETEIAPAVKARWEGSFVDLDAIDPDLLKTKKGPDAPFRAKVACKLFAELAADEQEVLHQRAKAEAQKARAEYVVAMKAGPSKSPEDRQKCIDNLGVFMTTVLRGVTEYTGLHGFAVFGGPIPAFGGELRTVHCAWGRNHAVPPVNFPQWSRPRFGRDVLDFMREYLRTAFTPIECVEAALPNADDDELAGAKYTIADKLGFPSDSVDEFDSDSDSSSSGRSDSDSASGSDSDSGSGAESEVEGGDGKRKKKKATAKARVKAREKEKEKRDSKKEKKRQAAEDREKDAASRMSKKRKGHDEQEENSDPSRLKKKRAPPPPVEPELEPELTYAQQRALNIATNKAALDKINREWAEKNPEAAKVEAAEWAKRERPKPRPIPRKDKSAPAAVEMRRSGRLSGGGESSTDVEMLDASLSGGDTPVSPPPPQAPPPLSPPLSNGAAPPPPPETSTYSHPPPPPPPLSNGAAPTPPPETSTGLHHPPPPSSNGAAPTPPPETSMYSHPPPPSPPPSVNGTSSQSSGESSGSEGRAGMETDTAVTSPEGENRTGTNIPVAHQRRRLGFAPFIPKSRWMIWAARITPFCSPLRSWSVCTGGLNLLANCLLWGGPERSGSGVTAGRGGSGTRGPMGQGRGPNIGTSAEFATEWWTWWGLLQPAWRTRDAKNPLRFLRTGYPATHGDWGVLRQPVKMES